MKKVNWGIIGLGAVASQFAQGFKYTKNANLLGIASRDNHKLLKFRDIYNIQKKYCYDNYKTLIKDENIQAIYIALPTSLHYEWISYSLKNNKKVLVEKPATMNSIEAVNIKKNFLKPNSFFTEAFMYLYHPQISKVIEIIKSDEIGELISMESSFGQNILTKKNIFGFKKKKKINPENRLYNKLMGGGAILDLGCYPISLSTLIASLKSEIDYKNIKLLNKKIEIGTTDVDIDSYVELEFNNDFKSKISASFTKDLGKKTIIIGTKGEIILEDTWTASAKNILIKKNNIEKLIEIKNIFNIYYHQIEVVSESILNNRTKLNFPILTVDQTIQNMKIIDEWLS